MSFLPSITHIGATPPTTVTPLYAIRPNFDSGQEPVPGIKPPTQSPRPILAPERTNLRIRGDWADAAGYQPGGRPASRQKQPQSIMAQLKTSPRIQTQIPTQKQSSNTRKQLSVGEEKSYESERFHNTAPLPSPNSSAVPPFPLPFPPFPAGSSPIGFPVPPPMPFQFPFPPSPVSGLAGVSPLGLPSGVPPTAVFPFPFPFPFPPAPVAAAPSQRAQIRKGKQTREDNIKPTSFVPFASKSHVLAPTAASKARIEKDESVEPSGVTKSLTAAVPPHKKAIKRPNLYSHLPPALQSTPYAALVASSTPASSKDPNHPSNDKSGHLPLPDGLDALSEWEREMLRHLSRVAGAMFDKSISPAFHPTPLELLFFLEFYKEAGIRFDKLSEAIQACQQAKNRVRAFLNHRERARGLLKEWSDGTLEGEKVERPSTAALAKEVSSAASAASDLPSEEVPTGDMFVERVDAIDLTLLFEQSRCAGNLFFHLRNLQLEGKSFENALHLTSAIMDEERNFQQRLQDLYTFLSSDSCLLFSVHMQGQLSSWPSLHSLLASQRSKQEVDELLIRCFSWNEELKQQKWSKEQQAQRAAEEAALSNPLSPIGSSSGLKSPRSSHGGPRKSPGAKKKVNTVASKVAQAWKEPAVHEKIPDPASLEKPRIKVFASMEELVALLRMEQDQSTATEQSDASKDSESPPTQLSTFFLGPRRLIGHLEELSLPDLQRIEGILNRTSSTEEEPLSEDDEAEQKDPSQPSDTPTVAGVDTKMKAKKSRHSKEANNGPVSDHAQLLFHLRVIRDEQLVQSRAQSLENDSRGNSDAPSFTSLHTLLEAVRVEHAASIKRREAIHSWLLEESDLFTLTPLRPEPVHNPMVQFQPLLTLAIPPILPHTTDSILSPQSLAKLYFESTGAGGTRLLYHIKQLVFKRIPERSLNYVAEPVDLQYRTKGSDGLPVAVTPGNHGFDFASDVTKLIEAVEQDALEFQTLAKELHTFLLSDSCILLTSAAKRTCNMDTVENILFFSETGAHTLSYLQRWNRNLRRVLRGSDGPDEEDLGKEKEETPITQAYNDVDDLVDALISHHVLTVKRNLIHHLETQFVSICPSLSSLNDLDVERIFSAARSREQLTMILNLIETPTEAGMKHGASAGWIDSDESVPTLYPTLGDFLLDLSALSISFQNQVSSAVKFLSSSECQVWNTEFRSELISEIIQEPDRVLSIFRRLGLEGADLLVKVNTAPVNQHKFVDLHQLHVALLEAQKDFAASKKPHRAMLRSFLEEEHTFLLRPFFRAKLQKQRAQHEADEARKRRAHARGSTVTGSMVLNVSGYGSRRASVVLSGSTTPGVVRSGRTSPTHSGGETPATAIPTAPTQSGSSKPITFPLTDRQIDGILSTAESPEMVLVMLQWLNDLFVEFASVESLVQELVQVHMRVVQSRATILREWPAWKLVDEAKPTVTLAGSRDDTIVHTPADMFQSREKETSQPNSNPSEGLSIVVDTSAGTSHSAAATPVPQTSQSEPASLTQPLDLRLILESQCGQDVVSFLRAFSASGHSFNTLTDLLHFLRIRWGASLRTRRRLFEQLCSESVDLFPETPGKISARIEVRRQNAAARVEKAKEEEQMSAAALAAIGAHAIGASSGTPSASLDHAASTATTKSTRNNRRGSMVGTLLPQWPSDAKPADSSSQPSQPALASSSSAARLAVPGSGASGSPNPDVDTIQPSTVPPTSQSQPQPPLFEDVPWCLTHRALHDLLMSVGPHVPFYVDTLIQARSDGVEATSPLATSFTTASQFASCISNMQLVSQKAVFNFIFDRHSAARAAVTAAAATTSAGKKSSVSVSVSADQFDYSVLPRHMLQSDIHSGPALPLLSSALITDLLESSSPVRDTSARIVQLFHVAEELTPYTLFFHLTHLSNPHQSPSLEFDVYRSFLSISPFSSWADLVSAIRVCQERWLAMRQSVHTLLAKHQHAAALRLAAFENMSRGGTGTTAAASMDDDSSLSPEFVSFFAPSQHVVTMRDVDTILLRSNAGLDALAWIESYSAAAQRAPMLSDAPGAAAAMFPSLEALQVQLSGDIFSVWTAVAATRATVLQELSEARSQLFEKPVHIAVQDLDALVSLVQESDSVVRGPAAPLSPSVSRAVEDVVWLIRYLVVLGRSFQDWTSFCTTLAFHWNTLRDQATELLRMLNTAPGRNLLGFLAPHQALSLDGAMRLARQSWAGIYTADLVEAMIEGSSPSVLSTSSIPSTTLGSQSQGKKSSHPTPLTHQTIADEAREAAAALAAQPVFASLDDMILAFRNNFRSQVLPSFEACNTAISTLLHTHAKELFADPDHEELVLTSSIVWDIFDQSGARLATTDILQQSYDEFRTFRNVKHLIHELKSFVEKERDDRRALLEFFESNVNVFSAGVIPTSASGSSASSHPAQSSKVIMTKRLLERLIVQGRCGSATRELVLDWHERGKIFPTFFDLVLVLREHADGKLRLINDTMRTLKGFLASDQCYLLSHTERLRERQFKHLVKVAGGDGDLCLALLQHMNQAVLPISASAATALDDPVPSPPPTASTIAPSARATPIPQPSISTVTPAHKDFGSLVDALLALHRATLTERDRVVEFFNTAHAPSSGSTNQSDRCKLWAASWTGYTSEKKQDSNIPLSPRNLISVEPEDVPRVSSDDALRMMMHSASFIYALPFLLQLNREESYTFHTMDELTLALRNLYLRWDESKRSIGRFLDSPKCILLPKRAANGMAKAKAYEPTSTMAVADESASDLAIRSLGSSPSVDTLNIPYSSITLRQVDRLLVSYQHGLYLPHKLLTFLRSVNDMKLKQHMNPRASLIGLEADQTLQSAAASSTAVFGNFTELNQFLRGRGDSALSAVMTEAYEWLNSVRCTLLRGPIRKDDGESVRADVIVQPSDVERLAHDSAAGVYLMNHLQSLQKSGFQCTRVDQLLVEVQSRVFWQGHEGLSVSTKPAPVPAPRL